MQNQTNRTVRTPSIQFLTNLRKLIKNTSQNIIVWSRPRHGFIIKDQLALQPHLKIFFRCNFDGFKRYLKLLGFKSHTNGTDIRFTHPLLLKQFKQERKANVNKSELVNKEDDQFPNQEEAEAHLNLKSNLQQISIEMKLRSQEQIVENTRKIKQGLVQAYYRKNELVQNFRNKYERCDALIDNLIYSLLLGHKQKNVDEESVLNQIAELQDIFSQSHRDINNCVAFLARQAELQDKISSVSINGTSNFNTGKSQSGFDGVKFNSNTVLNVEKKKE